MQDNRVYHCEGADNPDTPLSVHISVAGQCSLSSLVRHGRSGRVPTRHDLQIIQLAKIGDYHSAGGWGYALNDCEDLI